MHIRIPSPQLLLAVYGHQFNYIYKITCNDSVQQPFLYVEKQLHLFQINSTKELVIHSLKKEYFTISPDFLDF